MQKKVLNMLTTFKFNTFNEASGGTGPKKS